ncbi:MAG: hypothetical protein AB7V23_12195, partial [Candidatus Nanopelagicales bacterium]
IRQTADRTWILRLKPAPQVGADPGSRDPVTDRVTRLDCVGIPAVANPVTNEPDWPETADAADR